MDRDPADILVVHCGRLLTMAGGSDGLGAIPDGAVAVRGSRIAGVGSTSEILERFDAPEDRIAEAPDCVVLPGFVDPHTHVLFAGSREEEFALRLAGRTYMEIAASGGGILSSVRTFRRASDEQIVAETRGRLDRMLAQGTTTVEVKSGYGLDPEQEVRALRLIDRIDASHPIDLLGTFLGAHEFPPEYRGRRAEYVACVIEEMLPRVAGETHARFCDVFCEEGVFTPQEARAILVAAKEAGLAPRLHADEFAPSGASELAAELHALSADHLMEATPEGLRALRDAGTIAILLPGTSFSMGNRRYADARFMIEEGLRVALATDCNPGSSMTTSLPLILTLAVLEMKMTVAEALRGVTVHAAASLGLSRDVGSLASGMAADLQILPTAHEAGLVYHLGGIFPSRVMKAGEWVAVGGTLHASP